MIGNGTQYSYICTGQAFVFHRIPDDPAAVYFSICMPNLDVMEDGEKRTHHTDATQVFASLLQALCTGTLPESWHDEANKLDAWDVGYDDILRNFPATEPKHKEPRASPYKLKRWEVFKCSPIRTGQHCLQLDSNVGRLKEDDGDSPSPSPDPSGEEVVLSMGGTGEGGGGGRRGQRHGQQQEQA